MLSPFTLQSKETNGQQKAQGEIHSRDALTRHLGLQTLLAYLSFFLKQQISSWDVTAMWQNKEASCNLASSITGKAPSRRWFRKAPQQAVRREVGMLCMSRCQCWRWQQGRVVSYGWLKDTPMPAAQLTKVGEGIHLGLTCWEKFISPSPGIGLHLS